ncbi:MAG: SIR2 family protein, partial [Gammaproteobacteria bacterium]|nr:SIR2 family protein [Gammaproteobacteria bacterium]
LEEVLSRLRRISALVSGDDEVDGLTAEYSEKLDTLICQSIVNALNTTNLDPTAVDGLAAWVAHSNYHLPVELFTVNYDLLLENALENKKVPYFDGFIGTLEARFHPSLVERLPVSDSETIPAFFARLWKLHGSVNWAWKDDGQLVRLGQPVPSDLVAAIYPSDTKYEESRRVPFVVLQDRLRHSLFQPETLMLISGYSFSDDHLNEQIFDAATHCERSEFIAFCFSEIPDTLADQAITTPNLQVVTSNEAIIGGIRSDWKIPEADNPPNEIWDDNKFTLCDFKYLAKYLARSMMDDHENDNAL